MSTSSIEFLCSESLSLANRTIVAHAAAYDTIILLYEDDLTDRISACWAEPERLSVKTRPLGRMQNGIEIHSFGMGAFDSGTVVEISLQDRATGGERNPVRVLYRSLLNELIETKVKVFRSSDSSPNLR